MTSSSQVSTYFLLYDLFKTVPIDISNKIIYIASYTFFWLLYIKSVREVINATTLILAERTNPEEMNIINEDEKEIMKDYSCVCYLSSDNLGAILLMKRSYPHNSAKIVIHQVMNDVRTQIGSDLIKLQNPLSRPSVRLNLDLTDYLVKYHNPGEFDELQQTQELLNGVKAQIVFFDILKFIISYSSVYWAGHLSSV